VGVNIFMHTKIKKINGKEYEYLVESFRLPDGKLKKAEVLVKKRNREKDKKTLSKEILEKKKKEFSKYMIKNYEKDSVFDEKEVENIENIRVDYASLLKNVPRQAKKDLFDRFTANFTYESNSLEGNSLTLKDVNIIMFENASIKGKDLREIYETRNSREVVEKIINSGFKVTEKDIIEIHKILCRDLDISLGYKKFPNVLIGKNIKLTPPEKVEKEMNQLIKWYNENKSRIHPIKLAALFHGKFEQIHPFEDGNGRVGRFMINVILTENKYPPLIIRKSQRISYLTSLEKFDKKYPVYLERFILEKFKETYKKFFEVYVKYL
jgi:Fic family protein